MEGKPVAANTNRVYQDIEPLEEWVREQASDAFLVHLSGYKKENLKIQVTSARYVRVLGERPLGGNNWERFRKEFPIPSNCDPNDISAKFENGVLSVKLPKMIAPAVETKVPKTATTEAPKPPTQEAPKPPTKEAPKPPTQEAPKPPATEAPKLPKPMSTGGPQPQKTGANNQEQIKKSNEATSQGQHSNYAPPQTTEKEPSRVSKSSNQVEAEASNAAQKTMDKDKSGDGLDKIAAKSTEKLHEDRGKRVEDSTKDDLRRALFGHPEDNAGVEKRSFSYNFKQAVDRLVMEMKQQPRKMVNLGLAFLFVLVLWLYVKHTISSIQEIKRQEL
ncbi:protein RESTRICTED TEV MOVEMENT 2-like [Prunus yedoensis var. nudiflora]|uniref:Protein RESTRICTED TEV MOVEMENT 2-like n=1 Tax=Prunus yedoensis var. nudiflora TaxID=2094558 RepID=A0A314YCF6_PRUYE|nr:protein RESTRICTED TEV MOVEMENT 2-like [Prunus yedoensis var. nudiflora]PQQ18447.1 protein RESTRICTED TEV MOVEMENT 2-like [Prunus yedoensis var. nudiflora]